MREQSCKLGASGGRHHVGRESCHHRRAQLREPKTNIWKSGWVKWGGQGV